MGTIRFLATLVLGGVLNLCHAAGLSDLTNKEAASGLKEALVQGADYAVSTLGKENGFLGNPQARIPLPESLKTAEKTLRAVGMGKYADELVATMNHAAERAVVEAKPVLMDSVSRMTLQDAKGILTGGDNSVTEFFRRSTSEQLVQKFMPIVSESTKKVNLADRYNKFAGRAAKMGLLSEQDADLDTYITHKAMDGLFAMIAEKEKEIRHNPMAAGSDLLKKVFGAIR